MSNGTSREIGQFNMVCFFLYSSFHPTLPFYKLFRVIYRMKCLYQ